MSSPAPSPQNTPQQTPQPASEQAEWTIRRLLEWTKPFFERKGLDEPRLAAEILLAKALDCARLELYTRIDRVPSAEQLAVFRDFVNRAGAHTPIAYLVGFKEFYSLDFEVTSDVLVPRPETELLVERALASIAQVEGPVCALEIGTGSGCIPVATCKGADRVRFVATDISAEALELAARNAERHSVLDRVDFVQCDRLAIPSEHVPEGGFDLLISNPPYVALAEMDGLPANVRDHEPQMALHDGGDGLSFYRTFATESVGLLKLSGEVMLEIGDGQAEAVRDIFASGGAFEHVHTWRDAVGGHERVVGFRRSGPRATAH